MKLKVLKGCPSIGVYKGDVLKVKSDAVIKDSNVHSLIIAWMHNGEHHRVFYAKGSHNQKFNLTTGNKVVRVEKA